MSTTVPATTEWRAGADGSEKPAAELLAPGADLDVSPLQSWMRWLKPFWLLVAGAALAGVGATAWWLRRAWGLDHERREGHDERHEHEDAKKAKAAKPNAAKPWRKRKRKRR